MASVNTHFFKKTGLGRQEFKFDDPESERVRESRADRLNAYLECDAIDEYNFQVQAALLSTKVLKLLEREESMPSHPTGSMVRRVSKHTMSGIHSPGLYSISSSMVYPSVSRTRSSSWMSTQSMRTNPLSRPSPTASFTEGPLLDKILSAGCDSVPVAEISKMMSLLTNLHSYCPGTNSVGGTMGATCTVSDYTQIISSVDAMTRMVVHIRNSIESVNPYPLISATVPPSGRLIVCGDTHGQLEDLLWVFFKNGVPSANNIYVFNGDICDRGGHALEIFILLFLYKMNCYNSVHIIRGNHEDDYCNIYYGFLAELKHKFGPIHGGILHTEFLKLFYSLPLACVIDSWFGLYRCNITGAVIDLSKKDDGDSSPGRAIEVVLKRKDASNGHKAFIRGNELVFEKRQAKRGMNLDGVNILAWGSGSDSWEYISPRILVLHGGIPVPASFSSGSAVSLKSFRDLPHRMKIPPAPKNTLEQWMYQILWSDPSESPDHGPKGRGTPFYPHQTKSFLEMNNLHAVIRAHQVPPYQRGVGFHHKDKLVTIFTASNYCGSSQNYGGVAIFTPSLFPELAIDKTLFEHWAPPMGITRDLMAKNVNASQEVRMFIAAEVEGERAPIDRNSEGMLSHLDQKVAEYVGSLIVQHKRQLWAQFYAKNGTMTVSLEEWESVCSNVVGSHFPWPNLLDLLEVEVGKNDKGVKVVNFAEFLNRFKAGTNSTLTDTWESSVVRGFFGEIMAKRKVFTKLVMERFVSGGGPIMAAENLRDILHAVGSNISGTQTQIFIQALLSESEESPGQINLFSVLAVMAEYVRSYFSLIDAAPDVSGIDIIEVGRAANEFFPALRETIFKKYSHIEDALVRFWSECLGASTWELPIELAKQKLVTAIPGLDHTIVSRCLDFIATDEEQSGPAKELSFAQFIAACYIDGTTAGFTLRNRVIDHANSAVYFHRNALRVACVFMDKSRLGQIDRIAFQKAFSALNMSVDSEWRLSQRQQRCVIDFLRWEEDEGVTNTEKLMIDYDAFLEYVPIIYIRFPFPRSSFEIIDMQRMSRAASFGWRLVKGSFSVDGPTTEFSLEGMGLEGSMNH